MAKKSTKKILLLNKNKFKINLLIENKNLLTFKFLKIIVIINLKY